MRKYIYFTIVLLISCVTFGQSDLPDTPPVSESLVLDETGTLTASQERALEQKLLAYEDTTSTQIFIYIRSSVDDDIALFATDIAHKWGIGQGNSDNGCIILVAVDDRKLTIQNGYGLEPYLTDFNTKTIIDEIIVPEFRNGDYYSGLDRGTNAIFQVLAGTFEGSGTQPSNDKPQKFFVLLFIIILIIIISKGGGRGRGRYRGGGGYWIGGMGGFGGGGGSFGGGGGFGGFGGGGFGGGGASGSW